MSDSGNEVLAAMVPALRVDEFATATAEFSASKGMSQVTMWVTKERGAEIHAAGLALRAEIRSRDAISSEVPSVRP